MAKLHIDKFGESTVNLSLEDQDQWKYLNAICRSNGCNYDPASHTFVTNIDNLYNLLETLEKSMKPELIPSEDLLALLRDKINQTSKINTAHETVIEDIIKHMQSSWGINPYPHQINGAQWLHSKKYAILADDPGLGKTGTTCMALPRNKPVLILSLGSAKGVWKNEVKKWRPDYTFATIDKYIDMRLPQPGEILMTTIHMAPQLLAEKKPGLCLEHMLKTFPKEMILIIDESHKLCSRKTRCVKRIQQLVIATINRRGQIWFLTGTPLKDRQDQLFTMLQTGNMAMQLFGSLQNYQRLYKARPGPFGGVIYPDPKIIAPHKDLVEKLSRVLLRRTKEEVRPDLPPQIFQLIEVDSTLPRLAKQQMDKITETLGEGILANNEAFLQWLATADSTDIAQISGLRRDLATAKIPAMLEIIENYEDQEIPLVVVSQHLAPILTLENRPGWKTITGGRSKTKRTQAVEEFMDGTLKGVGLTLEAGGVSISLHRASEMLFVDLSWSPSNNEQAFMRILRALAIDHGCRYKIMTLDHPLERRVHEVLTAKHDIIRATIKKITSDKSSGTLEQLNGLLNKLLQPK